MTERHRRRSKEEALKRQFDLTEMLLDAVWGALEGDDLHRYIDKGQGAVVTMEALNEDRLGKLVKAAGEIFELQRLALGIPAYKERADEALAQAKLELERQKLAGQEGAVEDDGFLEALSLRSEELGVRGEE